MVNSGHPHESLPTLPWASVLQVSPIRLVPLGEEHVPALLETMRDPEVLRFTRTPDPMPQGWLAQWLARYDGEHRAAWAILDGEAFVGYAVTGPVNREDLEVEVGYAVSPWGRGRGVATETLRQLTEWAFAQGMQRVVALISVDNPASSRVAEKVGYTFEGVLRSVHHVGGRRGDLQSWSILPGELPDALQTGFQAGS
jgi:RimJ/RimL family protein N-acetyltransferase